MIRRQSKLHHQGAIGHRGEQPAGTTSGTAGWGTVASLGLLAPRACAALLILPLGFFACAATPPPPVREVLAVSWPVDNTAKIGGYKVGVFGAPAVVADGPSPAVCFDGQRDGVYFNLNPFHGQNELTIQVLFKPTSNGGAEQKVIHLQDDDGDNRTMMEVRPTGDGRWYLRSFVRAGLDERALQVKTVGHPYDQWHWVALVYAGGKLRHYVNGAQEAEGDLNGREMKRGEMTIGTRISREDWFKGCVREVRFANTALPAAELARQVDAPSRYASTRLKP